MKRTAWTVTLATLVCSHSPQGHSAEAAGPAGSSVVDKSRYHLFNPTPRDAMREPSTDRPDKTESAYTVDAGHFQIEADLISYAHDRDKSGGNRVTTDSYAVAPVNLKAGLCNRVDLQLMLDTYTHVRVKDRNAGTVRKQSGFGDITTRVKINLWGNDAGQTAMAVMPFVKFPSNQDDLGNDSVEGGVILPLAVALPGGWGMGVMTEFDVLRDADDDGYHASFINCITFAHDIYGNLGGFIEFFSEVSSEKDAEWVGTVDLGLTYGLTADIQLDGGVYIGVTDAADDVNPFVGVSFRF
jgi:hypothetical protein